MAEELHANCDSLLRSLSDYIDGELDEAMCREIQQHLETCDNCRAVLNTTRRTIDLVHLPPDASIGLPDEVRSRLFKRLDLESFIRPRGG